jgi:hypothetical protein
LRLWRLNGGLPRSIFELDWQIVARKRAGPSHYSG